jgi:hypothetical protein
MAAILSAQTSPGLTFYAHIRNSAGNIWNGSSFVAWNSANWATYAQAMSEQSSSGFYTVAFPSAITAGKYTFSIYQQIGGSAAIGDQPYGSDSIFWDGTNEVDQQSLTAGQASSVLTQVSAALNTAIPGSPTADSINERIKAIDDKLPSGTISDFDESANNVNLSSNQSGVTIGTVNSLGSTARTQINDEMLDVLVTDTQSELTSIPGATPTFKQILMLLYMMARNKRTASTTEEKVFNNAGTAIATAAISDSGVTYTKEQFS